MIIADLIGGLAGTLCGAIVVAVVSLLVGLYNLIKKSVAHEEGEREVVIGELWETPLEDDKFDPSWMKRISFDDEGNAYLDITDGASNNETKPNLYSVFYTKVKEK